MPRARTETPSVPTLRKWLEIYLTWLPQLEEKGGIQPEWAAKVAKGLKYSITALENSTKEWKKGKMEEHRAKVQDAWDKYE